MPAQLFKYRRWRWEARTDTAGSAETPVNYTERLLSSHSLFCQRPMGFDDPHDGHTGAFPTGSVHDLDRYALENMRSISQAMRTAGLTSLTQLQGSSNPEVRAAIAEGAARQARRACFVLSLSAVGDDDVMWSFYADEHRGVCLELDGAHPVFNGIRQVGYGVTTPPQSSDMGAVDSLLFHKSPSWGFQQEWRLISATAQFSFPPEVLRRVILGYRFPETEFDSLRAALSAGGYRVVIDQMQRQPGSYVLEPVRRGSVG